MKKTKNNIIIIIMIFIYFIFSKLTSIRICPIYNIFSIPCPTCGLTRAYFALLEGDIITSLNYNILAIPIATIFILYLIFCFKDDINSTDKVGMFFRKNYIWIILITAVVFVINWRINIYRGI